MFFANQGFFYLAKIKVFENSERILTIYLPILRQHGLIHDIIRFRRIWNHMKQNYYAWLTVENLLKGNTWRKMLQNISTNPKWLKEFVLEATTYQDKEKWSSWPWIRGHSKNVFKPRLLLFVTIFHVLQHTFWFFSWAAVQVSSNFNIPMLCKL